MKQEFITNLRLATKLLNIILDLAENGRDYRETMKTYNNMVFDYDLPLPTVVWKSNHQVEFC